MYKARARVVGLSHQNALSQWSPALLDLEDPLQFFQIEKGLGQFGGQQSPLGARLLIHERVVGLLEERLHVVYFLLVGPPFEVFVVGLWRLAKGNDATSQEESAVCQRKIKVREMKG